MKLYYAKDRYAADGSLAIMTYEMNEEDGFLEPYGMATVCLIDYGIKPKEGCVFMPTYKMPKEFVDTVIEDIVEEVIEEIPIGLGKGLYARLKDGWGENVEMTEWAW